MRLVAARQVELMNRGAALFDVHALVGDVGERADPDVELRFVGRQKQAAGPVPAAIVLGQPATWLGDPVRARRIGKGDHAIGIADVKRVADKRHSERLVQALEERVLRLSDAVTVGVAQERDAVGALADSGGPLHRSKHGVVEERGCIGSGVISASAVSTSPFGSTQIHRGCLRPVAKALTLSPAAAFGVWPAGQPLRGRHLERRKTALRLGERDGWIGARWRALLFGRPVPARRSLLRRSLRPLVKKHPEKAIASSPSNIARILV